MKFSNNSLMYLAYGLIAAFFIILMMRNMSFQTKLIEGLTDADKKADDSWHKDVNKSSKIIKTYINKNKKDFTQEEMAGEYISGGGLLAM